MFKRLALALSLFAPLAVAQQIPLTGSIGIPGNAAILGFQAISMTDANRTLTPTEWAHKFIKVTSSVSLTATRNLVAPLNPGQEFTVENATTGGQTIQVIGASGSGIIVPNGVTISVATDGINYTAGTVTAAGSFQELNMRGSGGNFAGSGAFADGAGNLHNTSIAATVNRILNGTAMPLPIIAGKLVNATFTNGSHTVVCTGCFGTGFTNWAFHGGDGTNGQLNGTLTYVDANTATMSGAAWSHTTASETFFFGYDNCTVAATWFSQGSTTSGRVMLPDGIYLSSCPILQPNANPFYIEGTSKRNTLLVDATPTAHNSFVAVGQTMNNVIAQINNIGILANNNAQFAIEVDGPITSTWSNIWAFDAINSSVYTNNGVGVSIDGLDIEPLYYSFLHPQHCIDVTGLTLTGGQGWGPGNINNMTCFQAQSQGIYVPNGQIAIANSQIDSNFGGSVYVGAVSYVTVADSLMQCELGGCSPGGVENHGNYQEIRAGAVDIHTYPGAFSQISDTTTNGVILFDAGSRGILNNLQLASGNGLVDNTVDGVQINGFLGNIPAAESQSTSFPLNQTCYAGGFQCKMNFNFNMTNSCATFGTAPCVTYPLEWRKFTGTGHAWRVDVIGDWGDGTTPRVISFTNTNPTQSIRGQTVTVRECDNATYCVLNQLVIYTSGGNAFQGLMVAYENYGGNIDYNLLTALAVDTQVVTATSDVESPNFDMNGQTANFGGSVNINGNLNVNGVGIGRTATVSSDLNSSGGIAVFESKSGSNCAHSATFYSVLNVRKWFQGMTSKCTDDWYLDSAANSNVVHVAQAAPTGSLDVETGVISSVNPFNGPYFGTGSGSNTDGAGELVLSAGTATFTFTLAHSQRPICAIHDHTTPANDATNTYTVTNTAITLNSTAGATDQIGWACTFRQ